MKKTFLFSICILIGYSLFAQKAFQVKVNQQVLLNYRQSSTYYSVGMGLDKPIMKKCVLSIGYNWGFLNGRGHSHVFDLETRLFLNKTYNGLFLAPHLSYTIYKEKIGENYYHDDNIMGAGFKLGYTISLKKYLITPFVGSNLASVPFPKKPFDLRVLLGIETGLLF